MKANGSAELSRSACPKPLGDPRVSVHLPLVLRECCGGAASLRVVAASVRAVLGELERRHPKLHRNICDDTGAIRRHINLFVNNQHLRDCRGLETPLVAGDEVTILPAVSGG